MLNLHAFARALRAEPGITDTQRLKFLNVVYERDPELTEARDERHRALATLRRIGTLAENGKVAVIESGRDCDCVQYAGLVHIIDATPAAYRDLYEHTAKWADGPFWFSVERPSVAARVEYTSRDRVLEAFENGHPYRV